MEYKRHFPVAAALAAAVLAFGFAPESAAQASAEAERDAGRMTQFILYTQWMDAFRTCGMETPEKLPKLFLDPGSTAAREWAAVVDPNFMPGTQADFMKGAIPLAGPFSDRKMVMGFYNPHWNAILLVQVTGDWPKTEEEVDSALLPKVSNLLFMSGEAFCGEHPEQPDFTTVIPGGAGHEGHPNEPLSPGLWRAQTKVMRRFNALYPAEADDNPRFKDDELLRGYDKDRDMEMLIARVAVRLKCLQGMDEDPEALGIAHRMQQVLQFGSRMQMKRYFENPMHDTFVTTFARLPHELKSGFVAYGCVATAEGRLFVLVNKDYPRLYATVTVPAGRLETAEAGDVDFEWFDLDQAEDLLKVWEEGEAARRAQEGATE